MADHNTTRGEFDLIRTMFERWNASGVAGDMGDDAALLPFSDSQLLVVTVDMLIEGRHFKSEWSSWKDIGYKSIAVNLSDIAAMGARPANLFISLGLTEELTTSDAFDELIKGMEEICHEFGCTIDGGDTTRSEQDAIISVTAMGKAQQSQVKKRDAARPGDIIAVTGTLGDAAAALDLLLDQTTTTPPDAKAIFDRLHRPVPRVKEGMWLATRPGVHAMIDLSDGLAGDIKHIMERSRCGAEIDLDRLPLSDELRQVAQLNNRNAAILAGRGGDDYELLFTVSPDRWDNLKEAFEAELSLPVSSIGTITDAEGDLEFTEAGQKLDHPLQSYDHFKSD